jgi:putative alpha-1,2-mannosidase
MAKGADRFFRQASALVHTVLADVAALASASAEISRIDWDYALLHMYADLRRTYGEDYLESGVAHPVSHTLDLAYGYHCTARIARRLGDDELAGRLDALAGGWRRAYDPATGLLIDSTYYEGGAWNYSFRLLHDMAGRIELAGGDEAFVEQLDRFFGFGAEPVKQLGEAPFGDAIAAGYALARFEGLNNEPDMEAPYAYHYAGRPDRTAAVVNAIVHQQFSTGRGGLPGNDDSGGLSSWYVWASLGLFPVAGQSVFLVSAPAFEHARLAVAGGELVIETGGFAGPGRDRPVQYVQGATFRGRPLLRSWLSGKEVHGGGVLRIELADRPSPWGRAHRPPSSPSTGPARPVSSSGKGRRPDG